MEVVSNLMAFLLPIVLFIYWMLVGYATLTLLHIRNNTVRNLLLSPATGIAVTLIPIFWFSQLGFPVKDFAAILFILLIFISFSVIFIKKPIVICKRYLSFFLIFVFALILVGRPLLSFGFNWISYANDDMTNYCLGALRFLNNGYNTPPNMAELSQGKNYSQYLWFLFIPEMIRSGSDLLLAWLSGLCKFNPTNLFMPLIITFHLTLISTAGGMLLISKKWNKISLISCFAIACSALNTLGTMYQLIAQVLGLSLFTLTITLLFEVLQKQYTNTRVVLCHAVLLALAASALLISYSELSPLLALSTLIYIIISLARQWKPTIKLIGALVFSVLISAIILNKYLLSILLFLQKQTANGIIDGKTDLFPYFLIPSGLTNIWGLQSLASIPREPWASITIFIAICMSVYALIHILKQINKLYTPAIIAFTMLILSILLYINKSGFGLFKLAMYAQPFLISVIVISIFNDAKPRKKTKIAILPLFILGLITQNDYIVDSLGTIGKPFAELSDASRTHLLTELSNAEKNLPNDGSIISDTASPIISKLQTLYLSDHATLFYSAPFLARLTSTGSTLFRTYKPSDYSAAATLTTKIDNFYKSQHFYLHDNANTMNKFTVPQYQFSSISHVIMESPIRNIINRKELSGAKNQNFIIEKMAHVKNHLIFINSQLGKFYYLGTPIDTSLNRLEHDFFYPNNSMVGLGKYLLFNIINPSKKYRFEINLTESLNSDGNCSLPPAIVIGNTPYHLPLMGRGSARVFSPELDAQLIDGKYYLMLDMNQLGKTFPPHRKGLMLLFGKNIVLDTRLLIGFARDISLVSSDEYKNLPAPNNIHQFPQDLSNTNLEYSGIYEDGWLSENAYLVLSKPSQDDKLIIAGEIPAYQKQVTSTQLVVYIDEKKIAEKNISVGKFQITLDTGKDIKKKNIHLVFSKLFHLPGDDNRPVIAKIGFIGFKKAST